LIILAQAKLDGTRWQVVPAYLCTVTCTGLNALGRVKGVRLPKIVCRFVALAGAAGAAVSTLAGVFAPVFPMPKPTGPYRVGKTTRLWIDRNRRSWLLKTKRKLGAQALPEHRMMMVNIWYPARREDDGSGKDSQPPWPADEEAEARFAERAAGFAAVEETAANATPRHTNVLKKQREETAKHQARFEKKRAEAKKSGRLRRAHWLDPTLATTLAESFYLPGWVVDYFRLVKMDAMEDAPVADPPRVLTKQKPRFTDTDANETESHCETTQGPGFPVVLFSHSFTGVKEQNSALLQEIASWGHIVVAVDHPHDAALVLYPDGSTADFRGYDMPKESEPRNWWRFRHEHARWRALDLAHALERTVELSYDDSSPLRGKIDLSRISCIGHSFGGAAAVMLAQMDPRITSVVALDPWMWPLGRETAMAGCPCPLLVFEAPEFMWNRDIFCVTNGETSSLMCAATAPQAVAREESGREEEKKETAEERARDAQAEAEPRASSDDSATEPNFSSPSDDVHRVEDPSKPPPGFLGDSVDGHAGVGFYNEHGYYYTSNPPKSPTSHRRSAHFRPQHPRVGSSENLASMTSMASLSSARSLGSVGSLEGVGGAAGFAGPTGRTQREGSHRGGGSGGGGGFVRLRTTSSRPVLARVPRRRGARLRTRLGVRRLFRRFRGGFAALAPERQLEQRPARGER
jgi:platelet-activating factor acetylhydrolase